MKGRWYLRPLAYSTALVVNSYTILYMCMEVIICQSDRTPERLVISLNPRIGGTSYQLRWEKRCGKNSPSFCIEFCKTLPAQNGIFLTFQKCLHLCICQYYRYSSEKLYSTVHVCGSSNLSIWEVPWKVYNILDPWHIVQLW